eukprot:COSAG01_NODE_20991_length_923_cov_1.990291_2_plen_79_part_01
MGAPQHNGKAGIVEGFDAAKGRHVVRVIGQAKPLRIKPANLQRVPEAAALASVAQQFAVVRAIDAAVAPVAAGGPQPEP